MATASARVCSVALWPRPSADKRHIPQSKCLARSRADRRTRSVARYDRRAHAATIPAVHISRLRRYASVVLLSFIATVCVTLLAPFVSPVTYELLCSASGHKLIAVTSDRDIVDVSGMPSMGTHGDGSGHCPMCMPAAPPPVFVTWDFVAVQPLAHVRQSIPAARLASLVGAPLPARGPPLLT